MNIAKLEYEFKSGQRCDAVNTCINICKAAGIEFVDVSFVIPDLSIGCIQYMTVRIHACSYVDDIVHLIENREKIMICAKNKTVPKI